MKANLLKSINKYYEIFIEKSLLSKKRRTQNFDFLSLKSLSPGAPTNADIIEFSNFLLQLKNRRSKNKAVCGYCIIFILKEIMTF